MSKEEVLRAFSAIKSETRGTGEGKGKRYDVDGCVYEINGDGSDGAYGMHITGTPYEIGLKLARYLHNGFGLSNSPGPFGLTLHITEGSEEA